MCGSLLILYTAYLKASSVGESWKKSKMKIVFKEHCQDVTFWSSVKIAPILITLVGRLDADSGGDGDADDNGDDGDDRDDGDDGDDGNEDPDHLGGKTEAWKRADHRERES